MELLIGCGSSREKKLHQQDKKEWSKLVTIDIDPACKPDIVGDASDPKLGWFADNTFDEVHAYDVLEHFGRQGDWRYFFAHWSGLWRILKPNGLLFGISPDSGSRWAWGDPGHARIISPECLVYLSQAQYQKQVGTTPMTDYRFVYKADFAIELSERAENGQHLYILRAIK